MTQDDAGKAKAKKAKKEKKAKAPMPKIADFAVDGTGSFKIADCPTSLGIDAAEEKRYKKKLLKNCERIAELQDKLFAERKEGVIFMLQAMDAAGKDSTVEHVFKLANPALMSSYAFKAPSKEELAHDYLWRANLHLPQRGSIGIFNRSHYEDVLIVRVNEMWKGYSWPERCYDMSEEDFFAMRYRQIADYERYLYENGYRFVKIFLNVGLDEQKARFISRIDEERKNWKFSAADLDNRPVWDKYMKAFEASIDATSTPEVPWYVIPADQKFVARWLVSEALLSVLEDIDPQYPGVSEEDKAEMAECKRKLEAGEI